MKNGLRTGFSQWIKVETNTHTDTNIKLQTRTNMALRRHSMGGEKNRHVKTETCVKKLF